MAPRQTQPTAGLSPVARLKASSSGDISAGGPSLAAAALCDERRFAEQQQ